MGSLISASPRAFRALLLVLFASVLGLPARAELRVTVSKTAVSQFESFGITVKDPREGADARPGPILVTMADSGDHQHDLYLEPTGRPGEWSGRFTPMRAGRYTGTALLDRGDEKEIGLVPLIRVQRGRKPGFVKVSSGARRALEFSNGRPFFPVGVRLVPEDIQPGSEWRPLMTRLLASEVNFLDLPVAWTADLSPEEQQSHLRHIDTALVEAERTGRIYLQLRLLPPADETEVGRSAYEAQIQRLARRWSYSPAVASFYLAGATQQVPPEVRQRWLRAIRAVDPYRHVVAVPGNPGEARPGGDLVVQPWNWQRPANRGALLEVPERFEGPAPLPGESSWQSLVLGGVGLPVWPFRPNAADSSAVLERIGKMGRAARRVPYQASPRQLSNVVSVDTPGSFCQYGRVCVGWVAPEADRVLNLSALPRGRYRVSFWDPALDAPAGTQQLWSTGSSARVELPQGLKTVFVQVEPTTAPTRQAAPIPPPRTVVRPKPTPRPKPAARRPVRVVVKPKPVVKKPRKPTRIELRRAAAAKKASAKKEAARKAAAKKAAARKKSARKSPSKKAATKKAVTRKKTAAKKAPSKSKKTVKKPARKTVATKATTRKKRRR